MKRINALLAIGCGLVLASLVLDFLKTDDWRLAGLVVAGVPLASLLGLWLAGLIGKKYYVVWQAAKHLLVGAAATVIDLRFFEFFAMLAMANPLAAKAVSFLISTVIKYIGNKYWAFVPIAERSRIRDGEAIGKKQENIWKEMALFLFITLIGLLIDIGIFHYATEILGPQLGVPGGIWIKLSVLAAAAAAAAWNFAGYKFFVFKK